MLIIVNEGGKDRSPDLANRSRDKSPDVSGSSDSSNVTTVRKLPSGKKTDSNVSCDTCICIGESASLLFADQSPPTCVLS